MKQQKIDVRKLCRACSGGKGEGICSYHANKFRIWHKQIDKQAKRKGA